MTKTNKEEILPGRKQAASILANKETFKQALIERIKAQKEGKVSKTIEEETDGFLTVMIDDKNI